LAISPIKGDSHFGDAIQIRGMDLFIAKNTGFGAQIIDSDEKDIHAFFFSGLKGA